MLNLCSSIVFFAVLAEIILSALPSSAPFFSALFCGALELSGGCAAASLLDRSCALPLCAFILGWGGFGVHFQIISACGEQKFLPLYFAVRLCQGLLCSGIVFLLLLTL